MDCFAGSGTTIASANELGRHWVGIDKSEQAIKLIQKRLAHTRASLFKTNLEYEMLMLEEKTNPALSKHKSG